MPTAPTPITPYGTPPSSSDPTNFDARADAKVAQDVIFVGEANALAANVFANATEAVAAAADALDERSQAETARIAAEAAANQSAASAGATLWVSGTNYPTGQRVWSPLNQQLYSRRVAGGGTTDPSLDYSNWRRVRIEADLQTARAFFLI